MTEKPNPQGIIAIMTTPTGEVIATAADFNRSGMGGCKLWEAQMWRARDAVRRKAVIAYCSTVVANVLSSYLLEQICSELVSRGGHKLTLRAVGYPEDVQAEVERR